MVKYSYTCKSACAVVLTNNEAENMKQEQFGDDHMLDILRHTKFRNARHVVDLMETEVEHHRNGAEPNDDMTIMCIKALQSN